MAELRNLLVFMDVKDRARVLKRYDTMFDEAGEEGETTLIRCFGSPVRQVLQIEQEYREALDKGEIPFADTEGVPMPPLEQSQPADLISAPPTAIAALEELPEVLFPAEPEEKIQEEIPVPEPVLPEMPAAETQFYHEPVPETVPEEPLPGEPALPEEEPPAAAPIEAHIPEEQEIQPPEETPRRPVSSREEEAEDDLEEDPEDREPSGGRKFAAVLVTIPMLVLWAAGFGVSLAAGVAVLAAGLTFGSAALYLMSYMFSGVITFTPDLMLVTGGALAMAAAALLLIWMGLWLAIGGCMLTVRISRNIYRGILGKGKEE